MIGPLLVFAAAVVLPGALALAGARWWRSEPDHFGAWNVGQ